MMRSDVALASLRYHEELPIYARREEIVAAIRREQVVIVTGEDRVRKNNSTP